MTTTNEKFYLPGFMDLSGYRLEKVKLDESWDVAVELSPQGTIFGKSEFITSLEKNFDHWKCFKNNELRAVVLLEKELDTNLVKHSGWVVYGGIMFMPHSPNQNNAQVLSEEFRVSSFIISELSQIYECLEFATHPNFTDLRPFLWHNYESEGPHFKCLLRYTTLLKLEDNNSLAMENNSTYKNLNKSRRQEIRYGKNSGIITSPSEDIDLFINIYQKTFENQKTDLAVQQTAIVKKILKNLSKNDNLQIFASSTSDGIIGSMAAFAIDKKRAYYIFGANSPVARESQTGTMVLWDGFEILRRLGVKYVDLEGVNSPKRGYFKLSFGGELCPYYIISLDKAE